jgi:hypothetical protein
MTPVKYFLSHCRVFDFQNRVWIQKIPINTVTLTNGWRLMVDARPTRTVCKTQRHNGQLKSKSSETKAEDG